MKHIYGQLLTIDDDSPRFNFKNGFSNRKFERESSRRHTPCFVERPWNFSFWHPSFFFFLLEYAKEEEYFPRGHINLHATRESRSSSGYSNGVTISFLYRVTKRFRGQSANIPRLFYRRVWIPREILRVLYVSSEGRLVFWDKLNYVW